MKAQCNPISTTDAITKAKVREELPSYLEIEEFVVLFPEQRIQSRHNKKQRISYLSKLLKMYKIESPLSLERFYLYLDEKQSRLSTVEVLSEKFCLFGCLVALSPIIRFQTNSKAYFLTELSISASGSSFSVVIVVCGECCRHYPFLTIGRYYIFSHLKLSSTDVGYENRKRKVLTTSKRTFVLYYHENDRFDNQNSCHKDNMISIVDINKISSLYKEDYRFNELISYAGTITGYVNDCILELDHSLLLLLTHYFIHNKGRSLRIGANIELYDVHILSINGSIKGFGCCTRSNLGIVRFSPLLEGSINRRRFQVHSPFT